MTREEAIMELNRFSGTTRLRLSANFWEALDRAIKSLEQEHCEDGFLKEWLESVPTEDVVEREKIDKAIEEITGYSRFHRDKTHNDTERGKYLAYEKCIEILKRNIGESKW